MSYFFEASGNVVWDPSLRIAKWFISFAESAASMIRVPTGLTPREDDTCDIDFPAFRRFVEGLYECYFSTRHPVQHELLRGPLLISLILLKRGGVVVVPNSENEAAFLREMEFLERSM